MGVWEPLLFSNILKLLFSSMAESLISGTIFYWHVLMVLLKPIGMNKGMYALHLLFFHWKEVIITIFTSQTMQFRKTVMIMVDMKKETRSVMKCWVNILKNYWVAKMRIHLKKIFCRKWNQLHWKQSKPLSQNLILKENSSTSNS